jgi:chromosomal replication initiator protein
MNSTTSELWNSCLEDIKKEISAGHFNTWFKNTSLNKRGGWNNLYRVPNDFIKEWMVTKYQKLILKKPGFLWRTT